MECTNLKGMKEYAYTINSIFKQFTLIKGKIIKQLTPRDEGERI